MRHQKRHLVRKNSLNWFTPAKKSRVIYGATEMFRRKPLPENGRSDLKMRGNLQMGIGVIVEGDGISSSLQKCCFFYKDSSYIYSYI